METFSALLAVCAGNSPVPGEFPSKRPVTRGFDVSFDLRWNKRLSTQSKRQWFETVPGEFPTQRLVTRSFEVFFDLRLNKRLNKQSAILPQNTMFHFAPEITFGKKPLCQL